MKRAQRKYYASYFSKIRLPELYSEDEVLIRLTILRGCGKPEIKTKARDELTLHFLRLTFAIAGRFIHKHPLLDRGDILAAGIKAVIEALQRIIDGESSMLTHNNLSAYIHSCIKGEIQNHCSIAGYVVIPPLNSAWLEQKIKTEGTDFLKTMFQTVQLQEEPVAQAGGENDYGKHTLQADTAQTMSTSAQRYHPALRQQQDVRSFMFVNDILQTDYLTIREKEILKMRMDDINEEDIGKHLHLSQQRISAIIKTRLIPVIRRLLKGDLA